MTFGAGTANHVQTPSEDGLYAEVYQVAKWHFAAERSGHTLQATALANEAWIRLSGGLNGSLPPPEQFLALASRVIRNILVDHARAKRAEKRGGGRQREDALERVTAAPPPDEHVDIEALNRALTRLASINERESRLIELRFFGGLEVEQAANVLGVSRSTAEADWRHARAWLRRELSDEAAGEGDES